MDWDETPEEMERRFIREAWEAEQDRISRDLRETWRVLVQDAHAMLERAKRFRDPTDLT